MHKIKVFDSLKCRRTDYIVTLLFFALLIVGFVFACTDAEYEYNQQIARGFISREAVFSVLITCLIKSLFIVVQYIFLSSK